MLSSLHQRNAAGLSASAEERCHDRQGQMLLGTDGRCAGMLYATDTCRRENVFETIASSDSSGSGLRNLILEVSATDVQVHIHLLCLRVYMEPGIVFNCIQYSPLLCRTSTQNGTKALLTV